MNSYRSEISNRRKTSSVHMTLHFGCISKQPNILMDMWMHFILGSVYMIFYHPKWNFMSVKVTDMKSIPTFSFKRTCALIHFASIHVNTSKELTDHGSEIFNRNDLQLSYRFEFILPLMWTYCQWLLNKMLLSPNSLCPSLCLLRLALPLPSWEDLRELGNIRKMSKRHRMIG